jgi:hypothetical protein
MLRKINFLRKIALINLYDVRKKRTEAFWEADKSTILLIGTYVNTWAGIERVLNEFIVLYHPNRIEKLNDLMPDSLEQKIKYLAAVSNDQRIPIELRQDLRRWVECIGRERSFRDLLVHGVGFPEKNLFERNWKFQSIKLRGKDFELVEKTVSKEQMRERSRAVSNLSHSIATNLKPILRPEL